MVVWFAFDSATKDFVDIIFNSVYLCSMTQSLKEIADRIIICGINNLPYYSDSPNIYAIFSFCSSDDLLWASLDFDSDFDDHHMSKFNNPPKNLNREQFRNYERTSLQEDLDTVSALLDKADGKKIIIHCKAGMDRSPAFTLLLLLRIQTQQKGEIDINSALATLNKISSYTRISGGMIRYADHLGDTYEECEKAVREFYDTKHLSDLCNHQESPKDRVSFIFRNRAIPSAHGYSESCAKFRIKPNKLALQTLRFMA